MSNVIALWDGGDSAVRKWWLNPFKFVDAEDILTHKRRAKMFFYDLLVNRPTEFRTLIVLFMIAYNNLDEDQVLLTERQEQAVNLARQAMVSGEPPVKYVSAHLGIDKSNASRLLKRAGFKLEIATFDDLFAVYVDGDSETTWSPTEQQIQAQKAKMTRECAASGTPGCKGTTRGRFALCLPCSQHYGALREDWLTSRHKHEPAPTWLLAEARRIDAQHRKDAINALYQAHVVYEDERVRRAA
jgi:hypothetical protein